MNSRLRSAFFGHFGLLLVVLMLCCHTASAQNASSPNFSLEHQSLNSGGGVTVSPSFSMTSCLGSDVAGAASSSSFNLQVGCVAATLASSLGGDDEDGDGISNAEEDSAPNNGDGNGDGTADRVQKGVASLSGAAGYVTVSVDPADGCDQLLGLSRQPGGAFGADPGFSHELGFVSFTVECSASGDSAPLEVIFHQGSPWPPVSYRNYGPQAPAFSGPIGFYELPGAFFDTVNIPGEGDTPRASFTLTDGQLGDHQAAGGTIVSTGGPAFAFAMSSVPTLGAVGTGIFAVLLGLVAVFILIRARMGGV